MRFWGCDTSGSSGSPAPGGCNDMAVVVGGAELGRQRPEPDRLYAATQANSLAMEEATLQETRLVRGRGEGEVGGRVVVKG